MQELCHDRDVTAAEAARAERLALSDLLLAVGPDAPTLCEGWTTRDLTAHLVIREGRPDAALGILGGPLARHTDSVQSATAQRPWSELVATVRSGPPRLSVFSLPGMDGTANLLEFAIHHEDVRRATEGWEPRILPAGEQDAIWSRLRAMSKLLVRRSPVGVVLQRSDSGQRVVAKKGQPAV
ncbi:MAG: TIGR03085 family metal-binding protein, partial [Candidatus Nanopelagicales bacterium]